VFWVIHLMKNLQKKVELNLILNLKISQDNQLNEEILLTFQIIKLNIQKTLSSLIYKKTVNAE
jgi:hypothetical protein